jgi:hypothetical protein
MNFLKHITRRHSVWTRCTVRRLFRTITKNCFTCGHMNTMNRARTTWKALTSTCSCCCWPAHSLVTASPMLPDAGQTETCTPVAQREVSLTGWLVSNWHEYDCSFVSQKYWMCHHLEGRRVKTLSGGRVRTCLYENCVLFVHYARQRNEYQMGHAQRFQPPESGRGVLSDVSVLLTCQRKYVKDLCNQELGKSGCMFLILSSDTTLE